MKKLLLLNSSFLVILSACSSQPNYDTQASQTGINVTRTNSSLNSACFGYSSTKETQLTGNNLLDVSIEVDKVNAGIPVLYSKSTMSANLYPQEFTLPAFTGLEGHVPNCDGISAKTDLDKKLGTTQNDFSDMVLNYQLEFGNTHIVVPQNYQNTTSVVMTSGNFEIKDGVGSTEKYVHTEFGDYVIRLSTTKGTSYKYVDLEKKIEKENLAIKSPFNSTLPDEKPGVTLQDIERAQNAPLGDTNTLPITNPNKTPNITP